MSLVKIALFCWLFPLIPSIYGDEKANSTDLSVDLTSSFSTQGYMILFLGYTNYF